MVPAHEHRACAQEAPALRAHQVTVGAGVVWSGGYDIGDATASCAATAPAATPPPIHAVHGGLARDAGHRAGIAGRLRRRRERLAVEFGLAFARPHVGVEIAGDAEAPSQELPGEELQQYVFDGGVTWQLPMRMGARMAPFVSGGAAFLRQLHEDRTLAETGQIYYAGGGARYWLRGGHGAAPRLWAARRCAREPPQERHRLRGQDAHLPDVLAVRLRWLLTCPPKPWRRWTSPSSSRRVGLARRSPRAGGRVDRDRRR